MTDQKQAVIFAILAVLCWSTVATAFKIALRTLEVPELLFIASVTATIILFVILLVRGDLPQIRHLRKRDYGISLISGLLNPIAYYLVLFTAYDRLPAQIAQPLNYTWPVALSLLAVPLLRQKLSLKAVAALFLSFLGVVLISAGSSDIDKSETDYLGIFLALFSSVIWALFWIIQLRSQINRVVQMFLNFALSSVILAVVLGIMGRIPPFNLNSYLPACYVGVFEMGLTFYLWLMGLQKARRTDFISNLAFLSPFLSLIFIHLILNETIHIFTIGGLILIVAGIYWQRRISAALQNRHGAS